MFIHRVIASGLLLPALGLVPLTGFAADSPSPRIEVTADYRYALRESEPVAEAKAHACREAWRLAVTNSSIYREETASVVDSPLLLDLAYTLATGHVQDQQIVEQTEKGRTLFCRVRGFLPTEESAHVIRTQLTANSGGAKVIDQNRALRILNTKDEGGSLLIQFQALKRLDWLNTAYQGSLREAADVMVDFYDESGVLIRTERHPARQSGTGQDVLNPGMLGLLKVPKPATAKSYRVWLVK